MFPLPSFNISRRIAGEVNEENPKTERSFTKLFSENSGKGLTDQNANVLLEIFPPFKGWFFEIYFVRLIGTPNQHYSKLIGAILRGRTKQVVHESLGFVTLFFRRV